MKILHRCVSGMLTAIFCLPAVAVEIKSRNFPPNLPDKVNMSADRGVTGNPIQILSATLGDSQDYTYQRNTLLCLDAANSRYGACPTRTEQYYAWASPPTTIRLDFVEKRSQYKTTIKLEGSRYSGKQLRSGLDSPYNDLFLGASEVWIVLKADMAQFPFGGDWTATLKTKVHQMWKSDIAYFTTQIEVKVTDSNNIQIHLSLPDPPHIDLQLRTPSGMHGTSSGHNEFDACLYDGYNANSMSYELTATDPLSHSTDFYVRAIKSLEGVNEDSARVRYQVYMPDFTGVGEPLKSGEQKRLKGIADAPMRQITLPGISVPVYCMPFSFYLDTPAFSVEEKEAGHYSGTLQLLFSPSTSN